MKLTIDLPDALAEQARNVAMRDGTTVRELILAGLHSEVERRSAAARIDFHFPTIRGDGLAGLTAAQALERSYGLPS